MKLIMNAVNGEYIRNLIEMADNEIKNGGTIERIDAAVAYVTSDELLFDWCWQRKIRLRLWGRFDEAVPISIPILQNFLTHRSPIYTCKLVRHFHPKVIWWRGLGAYIGSANLTNSAWYRNIEAGVFLTDDELIAGGHDLELEQFFKEIDSHSSPLTDELFNLLMARSREIDQQRERDREPARAFLATDHVQAWDGLSHVSGKKANDVARDAFLKEWNSTLQIIRDLAAQVSSDGARPSWVAPDAPPGAQADQFLNAYYYQRTFDGARADFESHFERARLNPEKAVAEAVTWWRSLSEAPDNEDRMLNEWAPYLRQKLAHDNIMRLTEEDLTGLFFRVHAVKDYSRRVPNKLVGLATGKHYNIEEKIEALSKTIYRRPKNGGVSALNSLNYILYDGSPDDLPSRMWKALHDPQLRIDNFGISAIGELVGWAMPDRFPPRNGRTSKALRSLGYDVTLHVQ